MCNRRLKLAFLCIITCLSNAPSDYWGFFAHRLINRTAVYTLPIDLYAFYKKHIEYVEYHSIDPDKRRYIVKAEGARHYIDLDHWPNYEHWIDQPLRDIIWDYATITIDGIDQVDTANDMSIRASPLSKEIYSAYIDSWSEILSEGRMRMQMHMDDRATHIMIKDNFSEHGILPFHISYYYDRLEQAFIDQHIADILKYSAEIGHYISDAHVPLHTTENYNGQLTGQHGIHAFWESRIPELFAFEEYDLLVDKAKYIEDVDAFIWDIVLDSHHLVDDVLSIERQLSSTWPQDQQYCYDERGLSITRLPCKAYAKAYQKAMKGMVERQMRKSIMAVGSLWYTAWENGGRPALAEQYHPAETNNSQIQAESHILRDH